MPSNTSLNLVDLDFDLQRNALKQFLRSQNILRDYDFEGSAMAVLLDLLTINTQRNIFYLNMNIAESFLDSAQLRDSILSHAKDLNYTARSARSPKATVSVTFEATSETQPYIIPKGSSFSTLIKNESFIFSIPETIICASPNTSFSFETDIYEGVYLKDSYVITNSIENERFRITNKNVDTESLSVVVFEDNSSIGQKYTLATTLLDLGASSKVFFLQASEAGFYEVLFGNGIIGQKPKSGSTVILDYRITKGPKAAGAKFFTINFDPTGIGNELTNTPNVQTVAVSAGGSDPETNDSIRFIAPRHFQVQERLVIAQDAEVLLREKFPEITAVAVFGGEDVDPPRFGKIFVSVDIADTDGLPDSKKTEYYNFLKRRCNLSIKPIFVQPEFTYVLVDTLVRYNINISSVSEENIRTIVVSAINDYHLNSLNNFNVVLRSSTLIDIINSVDPSIISNITKLQIYKKTVPLLATPQNMVVNFATELDDSFSHSETTYPIDDLTTIRSSAFRFNGQAVTLADDGNGVVRIVKNDGKNYTTIRNIGTIDYKMGKITLANFMVDSYDGGSLRIYARPKDLDIKAAQNTILGIEPAGINATVEFLTA
jgi:hypothetical protein